jgi:hypothetical protein
VEDGRKSGRTPKTEQVLTRLTPREMEILTSVAHLEDVTVSEIVRRLVATEASRRESDPHVQADLENVRSYRDRGGNLVDLRRRGHKPIS